jgi:hypothetical protein
VNEKLTHDAAWVTAVSIMECLEPKPDETGVGAQFAEIYERVKAGILVFEQLAERPGRRLAPSRN